MWDYRIQTGNFAFAGIDMALWDLCGKDCGRPLYQLFGGLQREEVDYFYYLSTGEWKASRAQCRDGVERGYSCFYLKVGVDASAEERMLETMRSTIGPSGKSGSTPTRPGRWRRRYSYLTRWHERFGIDFAEAPVRATRSS